MQIRLQLCVLALVAGFAGAASAQAPRGQLRAAPQPAAPAATTAIANRPLPGAPSANGLASPFPPSLASPGVPGTSAAGTVAPGAAPSDLVTEVPADAVATNVMGAGPYGTRGMVRPSGTGPLSNVDIARSFLGADGNRDGELTRAEAMRLTLMPLSFEEMDANHDDILTRSEYEEALR